MLKLIPLFFALQAGAALPPEPSDVSEHETVRHFVGTQRTTSPDGAIPYGEVVVALKRTILIDKGRIVEETVRSGAVGENVRKVTTYDRVSGTDEFLVMDDGTDRGSMKPLRGEMWKWSSWQVEVKLADGSLSSSTTVLGPDGMRTDRVVRSAKRTALYRQFDELKAVTKETYNRRVTDLLGEEPRFP